MNGRKSINGRGPEFRWVKLFNEYTNHKQTGWLRFTAKTQVRVPGIKKFMKKMIPIAK